MPDSAHIRVRRLSIIFLALAFAMLVGGFTFLKPRLRGLAFIIYWLGCFAVAGAAIIVAMLDLLVIRRDARKAQRDLIEDSFQGTSVKPPLPSAKTDKSPR
jgi:fatty acid desaturase